MYGGTVSTEDLQLAELRELCERPMRILTG